MNLVRNRLFAALLVLAPAAGLLVGSPAQAADLNVTVKSVSLSRSTLVLGSKARCTPVTVTAKLSAPMPAVKEGFSGVGVDIYEPGTGDIVKGEEIKRVGSSATYRGSVKFCGADVAGRYIARVYGVYAPKSEDDFDYVTTNVVSRSIYLKRPSSLSLNATPEPVRKGKKLTAKGVLKINGKAFAGAAVRVYFKADGASAYTYKGAAKTNAKGAYSKAFTATRSGTWKSVYAGSNARDAASAVDGVQVR
ncbi:hypothetical protein [Actinoplanes sp. G11-F43]|uniref:hypothetical protein n=1 Tax=Actinoplanes sp. G11-F43 TaxID=3424130 RepID=UPI003D35398B